MGPKVVEVRLIEKELKRRSDPGLIGEILPDVMEDIADRAGLGVHDTEAGS